MISGMRVRRRSSAGARGGDMVFTPVESQWGSISGASIPTAQKYFWSVTTVLNLGVSPAGLAQRVGVVRSGAPNYYRTYYHSGTRFQLPIRRGATIAQATLTPVEPSVTGSAPANALTLVWAFEQSGNAAPLDITEFATRRPPNTPDTAVQVSNQVYADWVDGSPDLSHQLQNIIDRPDWLPGNHVTIYVGVQGSSNSQVQFRSADAELHVVWN